MSYLRDTYPDFILRAWTVHEALTRIGYPSDWIFLVVYNDAVGIKLMDGEREHSILADAHDLEHKAVGELWAAFSKDISSNQNHDELMEIWGSKLNVILGKSVSFLTSLLDSGFNEHMPKLARGDALLH